MGANDDDPEGTGGEQPGGDGGGDAEDPPEQGDGGEQPAGDGDGDADDGGEGTPPAKPKGKAKGKPDGDGGGGDPPDPLTAGLQELGVHLEGAIKEHSEGLRGEMQQLKRDVDNRIELAEARYGRGTGGPDLGGAGGSRPAAQPRQKAWWEKLFW